MARSRRGSTFFSPIRRKTRYERFKEFLWQPETKQFLGRTGTGWGLILFFYLCLYLFLAAFFAACMFGLNATLDDHMPKYSLDSSPIGKTPGLTFRPLQKEVDQTGISLISFSPSDSDTWLFYVKQIKAELEVYNTTVNIGCVDKKTDENNVCGFDVAVLGTNCSEKTNFGYDSGEPCFLLRLNKLIGWIPEPYDNITDLGSIENYLAERGGDTFTYKKDYVGISCSSYKKEDKLLVGDVIVYPEDGFATKYFPYWNQKDYHSPLVMVQFKGMKRHEVIKIECKAWAKNVEQNRAKKRGFIRFEVNIE